MTTDLIQRAFHGQAVRIVTDEHGDPWFVAADVASILGYSITPAMTRRLDEDEKGMRPLHTPGGVQQMTVITESGLYAAILGSQIDGARAFKRWVTHELLPEVRRTGGYGMPKDYPSALRALAAEAESRAALAEKVEQDAPKVLFADSVARSDTTMLVSHLAVVLRANGVDIGTNRLFEWLRRDGYLCSRKGRDWNRPTQNAMDLGLFKPVDTVITHSDGQISEKTTPLVTGKGRIYFVNRYAARTAVPA
jgi:anti-repressor protein